MVQLNEVGEVRAAGGVPWRLDPTGGIQVLLVHRGNYDDWTIPKGKVEADETDEACAVREVEEETGLRGRLGRELPTVRWHDRLGRPKVARYWLLDVEPGDEARPANEVDALEWLALDEAVARLSYERDASVLRAIEAGDQTGSS